mgnify:CR=1 FL=1
MHIMKFVLPIEELFHLGHSRTNVTNNQQRFGSRVPNSKLFKKIETFAPENRLNVSVTSSGPNFIETFKL